MSSQRSPQTNDLTEKITDPLSSRTDPWRTATTHFPVGPTRGEPPRPAFQPDRPVANRHAPLSSRFDLWRTATPRFPAGPTRGEPPRLTFQPDRPVANRHEPLSSQTDLGRDAQPRSAAKRSKPASPQASRGTWVDREDGGGVPSSMDSSLMATSLRGARRGRSGAHRPIGRAEQRRCAA